MTTDHDRRPIVTSTFHDSDNADRAYHSLRERGYADKDINVIMTDDAREHFEKKNAEVVKVKDGNKAAEGTGVGAAVGGTTGGIIGALLGVGATVALPGIGLAIAGPIAGALAGAGAGGAAGSLLGALVGAGIDEETAKTYEKDLRDGGVMLGVHPRNEADHRYASETFERYDGRNVYASDYDYDAHRV